MKMTVIWLLAAVLGASMPAFGMATPSRPGVDAPELAHLGEFAVGVRTIELVQPAQVDVLAFDPESGTAPKRDRRLMVDLWYPATVAAGARPELYVADLPGEEPAELIRFSVPGIAVRNARPAGGRYPLVIVSHGRRNATAALSWLTENLASKGYVVAAIRHEDPVKSGLATLMQIVLRRPIDIAFVTASLQASLAAEGLIDPTRTALVGYSMGGYGVLVSGGAIPDPSGAPAKTIPGGLFLPYARGGAQAASVRVAHLKAIVALSPAGGGLLGVWDHASFAGIRAPLLLISGDNDHTVNYDTGARTFFDAATGTQRYLLTFKQGGHAIGLNPVPDEMRKRLYDIDWFEDPVWRKERIVAINLHMITAFLGRYVKDDESLAAYLDLPTADSSAGSWPSPGPAHFGDYSPGTNGITEWKGFQHNWSTGLQLLRQSADSPAR